MINTVITGSGHCLPEKIVKNTDFLGYEFYDENGVFIEKPVEEIIQKFQEITEIEERRYAEKHQFTSDLAVIAAEKAIKDAGIDKEDLDYVIVANRSEEHTSELQSRGHLVCRLLLEKKKKKKKSII